MKPITVTMQSFGSYLNRTVVDFTKLGDNAIFLITGATGGGKTTILDAMCFALYCKATGGRRSWSSMRSAAAPMGAETLVEFTFQLAGETYRFARSQSLYEARGSGALKTRESHACYRMKDGEWELLLSGAEARVREKAEELLGLTCEQFSQVIVLPQGDFLKLLLSSSRDKTQIFQTLFATVRWERATRNLKELASSLSREAGELEAAKKSILEQEAVENLPQLEQKQAALEKQLEQVQKERQAAEETLQKQNASVRVAEALTEQFSSLDKLKKRWEELERRADEMEKNRTKLEQARRAAGVYPYFSACQSAQKELAQKQRSFQAARERFQEAEKALQSARQQLPLAKECRECLPRLSQKEANLLRVRESAVRYQDVQKRCADTQKRINEQEKKQREAVIRLQTAEQQLRDGNTYIQQVQREISRMPQLLQEVQRLMDTDAAAVLAGHLQEGAPCPVCGSVHHPNPARPSTRLQAAQEALQKARQSADRLERAQKRLQERQEQREQAQRDCDAGRDAVSALRNMLEGQEATLRELEQTMGDLRALPEIDRQLSAVRAQSRDSTARAEKLEQNASHAESAAAAAAAAYKATETAQREAEAAVQAAQKQLDDSVLQAGLYPKEDYAALLLPPEQIQALEQMLTAYKAARESAYQQISALETELKGKAMPDLAAVRGAQTQAQKHVGELAQSFGKLEQGLASALQSLERLERLEQEGKQVEQAYARSSRLAMLLSGKNAYKIPLQQFVLGVMLDDILTSANQFFATLSSGRYSLNRITGPTGGNALSGLDMQVFDAYTGGARAVETLSGGELFLASLSLAFGLSDVVQSYSGGVHLDSLFIDEGFGTLDQETLDTAMKALAQLQSMGRTIGIISHVSELKNRIAAQIVVGKDPEGGSTAEVRMQ